MMRREPPAFAVWLLERFAPRGRSESLLGDLFEEYQTGRSRRWFWRETMAALLVFAWYGARLAASRRAAPVILALIAQSALLIGIVVLSAQSPRRCSAPTVLQGRAMLLMLCAVAAEAALVLRPRVQRPTLSAARRLRWVRLSVAMFAAVGFGGGALAWAATSSCAARLPVCATSDVPTSCARQDDPLSDRNRSFEHADPVDADVRRH
jgi:hypothetical protein